MIQSNSAKYHALLPPAQSVLPPTNIDASTSSATPPEGDPFLQEPLETKSSLTVSSSRTPSSSPAPRFREPAAEPDYDHPRSPVSIIFSTAFCPIYSSPPDCTVPLDDALHFFLRPASSITPMIWSHGPRARPLCSAIVQTLPLDFPSPLLHAPGAHHLAPKQTVDAPLPFRHQTAPVYRHLRLPSIFYVDLGSRPAGKPTFLFCRHQPAPHHPHYRRLWTLYTGHFTHRTDAYVYFLAFYTAYLRHHADAYVLGKLNLPPWAPSASVNRHTFMDYYNIKARACMYAAGKERHTVVGAVDTFFDHLLWAITSSSSTANSAPTASTSNTNPSPPCAWSPVIHLCKTTHHVSSDHLPPPTLLPYVPRVPRRQRRQRRQRLALAALHVTLF